MNLLLLAMAMLELAVSVTAPVPNFSGAWKQDNQRCSPVRTGDTTLKIEHRDPQLVVETVSKGLITRRASQRYTTDGVESISTGADGDEFHSTAIWTEGTLVFDIVEIEAGKRLKSTEVWSLIDDGKVLRRVRRSEKSGEQTLICVRTK